MDISKYPMVRVTWADAQEAGSGWLDIEDCANAKLAECQSVGWLVHQDDKKLIIMATIGKESSDAEVTTGGDCTAIPFDWVTKIEYLNSNSH